MALVESGPAATELAIQAQARFLGKLGEFGQPVIRKQADAIVAEFARNVVARFHSAAGTSQEGRGQSEIPRAQHRGAEQAVSPARSFEGRTMAIRAAVRWQILSLLTFVSLVRSIDALNFSVAAKQIMPEYGLTDVQMGVLYTAFTVGYGFFHLPGGWLADVVGPRLILAVAI